MKVKMKKCINSLLCMILFFTMFSGVKMEVLADTTQTIAANDVIDNPDNYIGLIYDRNDKIRNDSIGGITIYY